MKISDKVIEKRTVYDAYKRKKRENFSYRNTISKQGQIVFAGDSITDFFPLSDFLGEISVKTGLELYNRGISGDTTNRFYERFSDDILSLKPKMLVILMGTNDIGVGAAPSFTIKYFDKIFTMLKERLPECKVIVQAIYPVNKSLNKRCVNRRTNESVKALNKELKALSEKYGVLFVDLTQALIDENGNFNKDYTFDGLHPNAKGYSVISTELKGRGVFDLI